MIEYLIIGIVIAAAAGFTGWRAYQTVRISRDKACNAGCGKCSDKS